MKKRETNIIEHERFYRMCANPSRPVPEPIDQLFASQFWRPSFFRVAPRGISRRLASAWWLLHHLGGFANRGYGWLCIYLDGKLVHRTGIFPRYFRFPFMKRDELLFGDIWTDPKCRRRGLARYAVTSILHAYPNADYWYLVREENDASIKLAQSVGFELVATGVRTRRFGHSIFGRFEIRPVQDDSA